MKDEQLDELLSAALDGEATQAELALIAQTPGIDARLAELRISADAVSAMLPRVPTEQRKAMISAAVTSFMPVGVPGETAAAVGPEPLAENVVPIQAKSKNRFLSGASVLGGIAASVIVMVLLFNVVSPGLDDQGSPTANAELESDDSASSQSDSLDDADTESLSGEAGSAFTVSPQDEGGDGSAETTRSADEEASAPLQTTAVVAETTAAAQTTIAPDSTTEAPVATNPPAGDTKPSALELANSCWTKLSDEFGEFSVDVTTESLTENGHLRIPVLSQASEQFWLVAEPSGCAFVEMLPRP